MGLSVDKSLTLQHIPVLELLETAVESLHWNKFHRFIFLSETESHSEQFMILALFLFSLKCKMASSKIWIKRTALYRKGCIHFSLCASIFFFFFPHILELAQDLPFLNQKKIWCKEETSPVSWNWHKSNIFFFHIIKTEKAKQTKKAPKPKNPKHNRTPEKTSPKMP